MKSADTPQSRHISPVSNLKSMKTLFTGRQRQIVFGTVVLCFTVMAAMLFWPSSQQEPAGHAQSGQIEQPQPDLIAQQVKTKEQVQEEQQCLDEQVRQTLKENAETIRFMKNDGQVDNANVRYYFESPSGSVYIEQNRIRFVATDMTTITEKQKDGKKKIRPAIKATHTFSLYPIGANPDPEIELGDAFTTKYNYILGNDPSGWTSGVRAAKDLVLKDLYPGIDLRLYSTEDGNLEFDWVLAPGADFRQVQLRFEGQDNLSIDDAGNLDVALRFKDVKFHIPESYQVTDQGKEPVSLSFTHSDDNLVAFAAHSDIDARYPLVIDPTLTWGTFMDGNLTGSSTQVFDAYLLAIQVDPSDGVVYCAGGSNRQIPTGSAPYDADGYLNTITGLTGGTGASALPTVAIIYRMNSSGTDLLDLTLYGPSSVSGSNEVLAHAISLSSNRVFVGGFTTVDLPSAGTPFDATRNGTDGWVAVFSRDLGSLLYRTYLGSTGTEDIGVTCVRALNDTAFVVGMTVVAALPSSGTPDYIIGSPADATFGGASEMYIARFTNLNTLSWGSYVGGSSDEVFNDLEVFADGRVAFCGYGNGSITEVNPAASNSTNTNNDDGIIGVLNSGGTVFNYLDKIGGTGSNVDDHINDVEIVGDTLYWTGSAETGFPLGSGGYDASFNGGASDVVIGKVYSGGGSAGYRATFYGSGSTDIGNGIKLVSETDCEGNVTQSLLVWGTVGGSGLPTVNIGSDPFYNATYTSGGNSGYDMFFAAFPSALNSLVFGTYAGGNQDDYLGDTGVPRGANHLWVRNATIYLGTTTHSASHSPTMVSGGFDTSKSNGTNDSHMIIAIQFITLSETDYSDAPVSYGTPVHTLDCTHLRIGLLLDSELGAFPSTLADGDDNDNLDDEDGISSLPVLASGGPQNISITVNNLLNSTVFPAYLFGWIDLNSDGQFSANELDSVLVASGFSGSKTLDWTGVTVSGSISNHYVRIRLTTNSLVDDGGTSDVDERSTADASDGEVEDYLIQAIQECGNCDVVNGPSSVCPGSSDIFDAQITGACGNPVYTWSVTGNYTSFTPSGSSVTVTAGDTCSHPYTVSVSIACDDCDVSPITCNMNVAVEDLIPPSISCPADVTISCNDSSNPISTGMPTNITDNCSTGLGATFTDLGSGNSCDSTISRTWRVQDNCGNVTTCVQTITLIDNIPPVCPTPPADTIYSCMTDVPAPGNLTATDECQGNITVTGTDVNNGGGGCLRDTFFITRTWTFSDGCDNACQVSQLIGVVDEVAPSITCPDDVTVQCMDDVPAPNTNAVITNDNCSAVTVTFIGDVPSGSCPTIIARTYQAMDVCGNTIQCVQSIVVDDTTPPSITCPADVTVQCMDDVPAPDIAGVIASDNCGVPTVTFISDVPAGTCPTIISRTYQATDGCGNTAQCIQTIVVDDTTPPSITCPGDVTVQCFDDIPVASTTTVIASDNCGGVILTYLGDVPSGTCPTTITRTYQATDGCGNTAQCIQTITVDDTTPPSITCPGDVTVQCMDDVPAASTTTVIASDNCSGVILTYLGDVPSGTCPTTITRTYQATDGCGNTAQCVQTIIVDDTTPPTINCPADVTVECIDDAPVPDPAAVTAGDNCGGVTVTYLGQTNTGTCPEFLYRTYQATDDCGNTTTCVQTIRVDDTIPPSITCPDGGTYQCMDDVPAPDIAGVIASDNCGIATVTFISDVPAGTCPTIIIRTYQATDGCGNTARCVETIVVDDTTPPSITCPADVTVQCMDDVPAPDIAGVIASDNCGIPTVTFISDVPAGTCPTIISRTYQATDGCGNTAQCIQTIVVDDTTPPSITCPGDVTVQCFDDIPVASTTTVIASDNCGGVILTYLGDVPSGTCPTTITRTYQATDGCGNTAQCIQTITVDDTTPPSITCPGDVTVQCMDDVPAASTTTVIASDNCSGVILTYLGDVPSGTCPTTITRTYQATDGCGNTAQCVQTIIVDDTTPPTINCPADVTVECIDDAPVPDPAAVTAGDNCGGVTVTYLGQTNTGTCPEFLYRTYQATDDCGNTTTCVQTIRVDDTIPPSITCPDGGTYQCMDDVPAPDIAGVIASDNCGIATVTFISDVPAGTCPTIIIRTYQATDGCGNTARCVETIVVDDTTPPSITCPADVTVQCMDDVPAPDVAGVIASDNCGIPTVTFISDVPAGTCPTIISRTYQATDGCGNTAQCIQTITVDDTTPPTITCPADVVMEWPPIFNMEPVPPNVPQDPSVNPAVTGIPGVDDNCGIPNVMFQDQLFGPFPQNCPFLWYITRTWKATDNCNNMATCTQRITFTDLTPPQINCPPALTFECVDQVPPVTVSLSQVTATDNCGTPLVTFVGETMNGSCPKVIVRTFKATDNCNNMTTCTQQIIINDLTPPTINCPGDVTVQCIDDAPVPDPAAVTAGDNCGGVTVTYLGQTNTGTCPEFLYRTYQATDDCGNTTTCVQTIRVDDTIPPSITCPDGGTYQCMDDVPAPDIAGVIASDNCGIATVTFIGDVPAGTCPTIIIRTYQATDGCGNTARCVETIVVDDTTPPAPFDCPPAVDLGCNPTFPDDLPPPAELTTIDNCAGVITAELLPSDVVVVGCQARLLRIYRATDNCGNAVSCTQLITWTIDQTAPSIECPQDEFLGCNPDEIPAPEQLTGVDFCSGSVAASASDGPVVEDGCSRSITRTYSATDDCGNTVSCTQHITWISDTTPPMLTNCDSRVYDGCNATAEEILLNADFGVYASANDNCSLDILTYTYTINEVNCGASVTFHWRAVDDCNNVSSCTQTITVADRSAPQLTVPEDVTIQCGNEATADASAVDNCSEPFVTYVDLQCSLSVEGFTGDYDFSNWTATEPDGGYVTTDGDSSVTVHGPDGGNCNGLATLYSITIPADGKLIFSWNYESFDCCGAYWDPFGYNINGTFVKLTQDNGPNSGNPIQSGLAAVLVHTGDVFSFEVYSPDCVLGEGASTVIDFFVYTCAEEEPEDPCNYTVFRCWSATDACGNTAYGLQRIHVEDTTPPTIQCPGDVTVQCIDDKPAPDPASVVATDNCGSATVTFIGDEAQGTCPTTVSRKYQAVDACGNTATCIQTIIVDDTTPPTISCPEGGIVQCMDDVPDPDPSTVTASDNCGAVTVTFIGDQPSEQSCPKIIVRTYQATDACGNTAQCVETIVVYDTTPPDPLPCPADMDLGCNPVLVNGIPAPPELTTTDNCDGVITATVETSEDVVDGCLHSVTRTYRATDNCGNSVSCTQMITWVVDTTPPDLQCPPDGEPLGCNPETLPAPQEQVFGFDECSEVNATAEIVENDTTGCLGVLVYKYTATDDCGNSATCTQRYTYTVDHESPVMQCSKPAPIFCPDEMPDPEYLAQWLIDQHYANATDDCPGDLTIEFVDFYELNNSCSMAWTFRYTAEDGCGNHADTCEIIVQIYHDEIPPVITCSDVPHLGCNPDSIPSPQYLLDHGYVSATDDCGSVTIGFLPPYTDTEEGCEHIRAFRFRATDGCGNQSEICTVHVPWTADLVPPSLTCPEDLTLECDDPIPAPAQATATDDCTLVLVTFVGETGSGNACDSLIVRHYYAVDACGNEATCTQHIRILDTTPPDIACPGLVVLECGIDTVPVTMATVTDNCTLIPFVTYSDEEYPQQCGPGNFVDGRNKVVSLIVRTFRATDNCNNTSSCTEHILIRDDTPPMLTCPGNITIRCDQDPNDLALTGEGIAHDLCDPDAYATILITQVVDSNLCTKVLQRYWIATDRCGNGGSSELCYQFITIVDTTPPTISCPADVTIECGDPIPTTLAAAEDNCHEVNVTYSDVDLGVSCPMVIMRTHYATDACGNTSSCTQYIVIVDTTPPSLDCPEDVTIECGDPLPGPSATAFDVCDPDATVTYSDHICNFGAVGFTGDFDPQNWTITTSFGGDVIVNGDETVELIGPNSGEGCPGGSSTEYSVVIQMDGELVFLWNYHTEDVDGPTYDPFGYSLNGTFYKLTDNDGPVSQAGVAVVPVSTGDVFAFSQLSTDCILGAGATTLVDFFGCSGEQGYSCDQVVIRTYRAEDHCGNASVCGQRIFVEDTTPPSITCPSDVTIECGDPIPTTNATASDICDPEVYVTQVGESTVYVDGTCLYKVIRTFRAIDGCENSSTCTQVVTVEDTTPPDVTCPDDYTIACDELTCLTFDDISVDANGPLVDISSVPVGDVTVGIQAWSKLGMATPSIFNTEDPHSGCEDLGTPNVVYGGPGISGDNPDGYEFSNNEAEGKAVIIQTPTLGFPDDYLLSDSLVFTFSDPVYLVSLVAIDFESAQLVTGAGVFMYDMNGASLGFKPLGGGGDNNVEELYLQQPSVKKLVVYYGDTIPTSGAIASLCFVHVPLDPEEAIVHDACNEVEITVDEQTNVIDECTTELLRSFSAVDACGNANNDACTQTITLETDTEQPEITCPEDITLDCNADVPPVDIAGVLASDNCTAPGDLVVTWVRDITTGDACETILRRIYRVTDACGNSALCAQFMHFVDTTPPVIACPGDVTIECGSPLPTTLATATDDCNQWTVTYEDGAPQGLCPMVITRTHYATDACGNVSSCTQHIYLQDTTPPAIDCPADVTIECGSPLPTTLATATDVCNAVTVTYADSAPEGDCPTVITRTHYATDACGNVSSCTQHITIEDTTPPVIVCPPDMTLECNVNPIPTTLATATDICHAVTVTYSDEEYPQSCANDTIIAGVDQVLEIIVRTHYATDACGNVSSCTQHFVIRDDTPPEITCPPNITIECTQDPDSVQLTGTPMVHDLCDPEAYAYILITVVTDTSQCHKVLTRYWQATDHCGNGTSSGLCSQTITIVDTTPPSITCPADVTIECGDALPSTLATGTDSCHTVTFTYVDADTAGICPAVIVRTHYAIDACGNVASCTQHIYIEDTTPPEISCPGDLTVECYGDIPAADPGAIVATDNCDADVVVTHVGDMIITGTLYACDVYGNYYHINYLTGAATYVNTFSSVLPTTSLEYNPLDGRAFLQTAAGTNLGQEFNPQTGALIGAAISNTPVAIRSLTGMEFVGGVLYVTYVESVSGPSTFATLDPNTGALSDISAHFGCAPVPISGLAYDPLTGIMYGSGGPSGILYRISLITGVATPIGPMGAVLGGLEFGPDGVLYGGGAQDDAGTFFKVNTTTGVATAVGPTGLSVETPLSGLMLVGSGGCDIIVKRTYSASDACDNTTTCTQHIVVSDTTPPVIVCPPDMTLECDQEYPTTLATATDNCGIAWVTYQDSPIQGVCGQNVFVDGENRVLILIVRKHYAIDRCGNVATCTQHLVIRDDVAPTVVCPPNRTIDCGDPTDPEFTGYPDVTDNCDPNPQPIYVDLQGGNSCTHVITRVWTATDWCGNGMSGNICIQTITILDTTPPSITCPADVTIECGDALPTTLATGTDDCNAVTFSYTDSDTLGMCPGLIIRTHSATDACGNVSHCTQHIYIEDTTPPTIQCPADMTLECNVNPLPTTLATASDACSAVTVTYSDAVYPQVCANDTFVAGVDQVLEIIVRTHYATDACGNVASCTQHLVIRDDTPPDIICPSDITIECDQDLNDLQVTGTPQVSDLCDPEAYAYILLTYVSDPDPCHTVYTRLWQATDRCGNGTSSGLCQQFITLVDTIPPTITCPADVTIECGDPLPTTLATGTDACHAVTFTYEDSDTLGSCPALIIRTHYATDACGNASNCTQHIYIQDTTPPSIECSEPIVIGCQDTIPEIPPIVTDNCSPDIDLTYTDVAAPDQNHCAWLTERQWTATDACGNSTGCVQLIIRQDLTPPVITCPADVTIECGDDLPPVGATATDDCDPDVFVTLVSQSPPGMGCAYNIIRVYRAQDACGRTSSCTQVITVEDTTPPELTCPPPFELSCMDNTCLTFDEYEVGADSVLIPTIVAGGVTVHITAWSKGGVMQSPGLFNSANPHAGDEDLGTPNTLYGGPGLNMNDPDGYAPSNNEPLGNILIVQEPTKGYPDDDALSDSLVLTFSEPVYLEVSMPWILKLRSRMPARGSHCMMRMVR